MRESIQKRNREGSLASRQFIPRVLAQTSLSVVRSAEFCEDFGYTAVPQETRNVCKYLGEPSESERGSNILQVHHSSTEER